MLTYHYNFNQLDGGDILLITPPPIPPVAPLSATAYLAATLRKHDVNVDLLDLGLDAQKWFTEPDHIKKQLTTYPSNEVSLYTKNGFFQGIVPTKAIAPNIVKSSQVFRQKYSDCSAYREACKIYGAAFQIYDDIVHKTRISPPGSYFSPWKNLDLATTMNDLLGEADIHRHFIDAATTEILKHHYKIIGFSILHGEQWCPAWGLAKALKLKGFSGKIVFGGVQVSFFVDHIKENLDFFRYVDWYSPKRGDVFCEDAKRFCQGSLDAIDIRNIFYVTQKRKIQYTGGYQEYSVRTMLPPDYSGLLLKDYLAPEISLPIQSITKCYWGKCSFCMVTGNLLVKHPTIASADQILKQMIILYERFKCSHFFFVDDSTSPRLLTGVAKLIIKNKLPFFWQVKGMIPEKYITFDVLQEWQAGGCRALSMGFETASSKLLTELNKKHTLEDISRILIDCNKLKITTYCSGFYGYPKETKEDIIETLKFRKEYENIATLFLLYTWSLNPHSIDHKNVQNLGINMIQEDTQRTYGKRVANIRWNSPNKDKMEQTLSELSAEYQAPSQPRNYFWSDWLYFGHSLHIPYEWTS